MFKMSNGANKVEENKRISYPEEKKVDILIKKEKSAEKLLIVQERGIETYKSKIETKSKSLKRHDERVFQKMFMQHLCFHNSLLIFLKRSWSSIIILIKLAQYLRERNKFERSDRYKRAYFRQLRSVTMIKALKNIRKRGKSPKSRTVFEAKLMLLHHLSFNKKALKKKAGLIIKHILIQAGFVLFFDKKLDTYNNNVKKIQKKWKLLKTRKLMYKATIRNLWNKNSSNFFIILKQEKQGKNKEENMGMNENLLFNNMLLGNIRSRRNENSQSAAAMMIDMFFFYFYT